MHFSPRQFDLIHTFHEIQIKYLSTFPTNVQTSSFPSKRVLHFNL